jgi:hypothetical protein
VYISLPRTNLKSHDILMLLLISMLIQSRGCLTIHLAESLPLRAGPRCRQCHVRWIASTNRPPSSRGGGCILPWPEPNVALSPGGRPGGAEYHRRLLSFSVLTNDTAASLQSHAHETACMPQLNAMQDSGGRLFRLGTLHKHRPQGLIRRTCAGKYTITFCRLNIFLVI